MAGKRMTKAQFSALLRFLGSYRPPTGVGFHAVVSPLDRSATLVVSIGETHAMREDVRLAVDLDLLTKRLNWLADGLIEIKASTDDIRERREAEWQAFAARADLADPKIL